jgi:lysophospholipase L1-like esterase
MSWTVERHRAGVVYANLGTIGATIEIVGRWDDATLATELAVTQPVAVLIAFGTNEGFHDTTEGAVYRSTFAAQLRRLHHHAPNAALVVLGPPDGNRPTPASDAAQSCGDAKQHGMHWAPPPKLAVVRDAQRAVAREEGAWFWDWEAAMGGPCSIHGWVERDPPWALADHVHLRSAGYRATADRLFAALMAEYERFRAAP